LDRINRMERYCQKFYEEYENEDRLTTTATTTDHE